MKKVLAFGASNSKASINRKFAIYATQQLTNIESTIIDLNDFEMPIYCINTEQEQGIPQKAQQFSDLIETHDAVLISLAEHNGNYAVAFKNITDWVSRLEGKVWKNKAIMLLSTSPGGRGGAGVMDIAMTSMPHAGANIVASFSLPSFGANFDDDAGITNSELKDAFTQQCQALMDALT